MKRIAIIDYGSGNLRSVAKALERVAASTAQVDVVNTPEKLSAATHIVLPGVGAFADCMKGLQALPGMLAALEEQVRKNQKNFLGICVGMQMLFERGHEFGVHAGLGWLKGEVKGIGDLGLGIREENPLRQSPIPNPQSLKIPHMGWNDLEIKQTHPLLADVNTGDHAYFVHSFHATGVQQEAILATCNYGQNIVAVVGQGNIMGTQFHPEKSQETGLKILANFIAMPS